MGAENVDSRLPGGGILHVFDAVNRVHGHVDSVEKWRQIVDPEERQELIYDYFNSALNYLESESGSPYLAELVYTATLAFTASEVAAGIALESGSAAVPNEVLEKRVFPWTSADVYTAIDEIGTSRQPRQIKAALAKDDPVFTGVGGEPYFIIPFGFVEKARTSPIEAIAILASRLSIVRDYVHGDPMIQDHVNMRGNATAIDVYNIAIDTVPAEQLPPIARSIRDVRPRSKGVTGLPARIRYTGKYPHPRFPSR